MVGRSFRIDADRTRVDRLSLFLLACAAILFGAGLRIWLNADRPFWSDEAFTGAVAMQPTFAGLTSDTLNDVQGPIYYLFIWTWAKFAGFSDAALRTPSIVFSLLVPVLLAWKGHSDLKVRLTWAALTAVSIPLVEHANDARYYSLVVLIAAVQTIAYVRLMQQPAVGRAAVWSGISVCLILTHYHTVPMVGLQAVIYLVVHRSTALRTWPAGLFVLPLLAWLLPHSLTLVRIGSTTWQPLLKFGDLARVPDAIFGFGAALSGLCGLIAGFSVVMTFARDRDRAASAAVAAALLAILFISVASLFVRNYAPRYLLPYIPAVLLGLSLIARRWRWGPSAIIVAFSTFCCSHSLRRDVWIAENMRWQLSWQRAADDLSKQKVDRVVFYWNSPVAPAPDMLRRHGEFFYTRRDNSPELLLGPVGRFDLTPHEVLAAAPYSPGRTGLIYVLAKTTSLDAFRTQELACRRHGTLGQRTIVACLSSADR